MPVHLVCYDVILCAARVISKTLGDLLSDATTAVARASSRLVCHVLDFCHRPPQCLWEVEERKEESNQQDGTEGNEAVGAHDLVHERPPDANDEVRRPVNLARHGHRRGDVPEDDGDHIHLNISVIFGDRCGLEGYLWKCFFSQKIKELLLKNTKNVETILTSVPLQIYFSSIIL